MEYEFLEAADFYLSLRSYMGGEGDPPWSLFLVKDYFRWLVTDMERVANPIDVIDVEDLAPERLGDLEHYRDVIIWDIIFEFFSRGWFEGDEEGEVEGDRWMQMRQTLLTFLDEPVPQEYRCFICNNGSMNGVCCPFCCSWTLLEMDNQQPIPIFTPDYVHACEERRDQVHSIHLHPLAVASHSFPLMIAGVFCPCCQEINQDRKAVTLNLCHHEFHGICIRQWFLSQVIWRCPLCQLVYHGETDSSSSSDDDSSSDDSSSSDDVSSSDDDDDVSSSDDDDVSSSSSSSFGGDDDGAGGEDPMQDDGGGGEDPMQDEDVGAL